MSSVLQTPQTPLDPASAAGQTVTAPPLSPNQRAWARFRRNRLGYVSLWLFGMLLLVGTFAELLSNEMCIRDSPCPEAAVGVRMIRSMLPPTDVPPASGFAR